MLLKDGTTEIKRSFLKIFFGGHRRLPQKWLYLQRYTGHKCGNQVHATQNIFHYFIFVFRGNPIRFGYKNWMLASCTGYCYDFESDVGLGSQVVLNFVTKIPHPENRLIVFDNFFTSYPLMLTLKELQFKSTGTVRENRWRLET